MISSVIKGHLAIATIFKFDYFFRTVMQQLQAKFQVSYSVARSL